MTAWIEVLVALTDGPRLPVRGTIRESRADTEPERVSFGWVGPAPMLVLAGNECRVWRDGNRLRIEDADGRPTFVTDGTRAWDFSEDAQRPRTGPADRIRYLGGNAFLLSRRNPAEWLGDDFTRPTGDVAETEFAGRRCWTVELAPPPRKTHPLRIWVDVESGQMLGFRSEHAGEGAQFVDPVVGERLDDALFAWTGPVITVEEHEQLRRDQGRARSREQAAWFAENVTAAPITARVEVDFTPTSVSYHDELTGAFDAHNNQVSLSRRQRSDEGWLPRWGAAHYVWSTPQWDWAAASGQLGLDDEAVGQLQHALHPGDSVDRQRRIAPPDHGRGRAVRTTGAGS